MYSFLGFLAPLSRGLSRFRFSSLSGNIWVIFLLTASIGANIKRLTTERPIQTVSIVVIVIASVLLLSFLWLWHNRAVVFVPSGSVPIPGALRKPMMESLLVSGVFTSDGRSHRFFTNAPGSLTRSESGASGVISLIEGARSVWGAERVTHQGLWVAPIRAGTITDLQVGHVFWGRQKLRAVRFRFANRITGQPDRAVIASAEMDPLAALRSVNLV